MNEPLHLLYLDRDHLNDLLFTQALARSLAGPAVPPCVIVHSSGEHAERMLESQGIFAERTGGVLSATSPQEVALLARALRETTQKLVGMLTDAVVYAVGMQGADRGLLRLRPDGRLAAGRTGWVRELAAKQAVPVIAATVMDAQHLLREVDLAEAATVLGTALGAGEGGVEIVFFTKANRPGVVSGKTVVPEIAPAELPSTDVLPEPDAVRRVVQAGLPARLTNLGGFPGGEGTRVVL